MKILYFAWVREMTGTGEEEIAWSEELKTVRDLVAHLRQRNSAYQQAFGDDKMVRTAVNQEYADLDQALSKDDEVAFFPPVTGG